jgi:hypothetical protein
MDTPTRESCLQNAAAHISASRSQVEDDAGKDRHIARAAVYAEMAKSAPTEPAPAPQDDATALLVALVSEWQNQKATYERLGINVENHTPDDLLELWQKAEAFVRDAAKGDAKP